MVWFTIWFMVILKIPILYFAYVMWWALKDAPDSPGTGSDTSGGDGPSRGPRLGRRGGPHGTHSRRLFRAARRRART
jgi:hypothetical protein